MKYLFVILSLFYFEQLCAQYNPDKVNKKALKWYQKSQDQAREDQFQEGIKSLKEAVKIDDGYEDAWLSMAGMYGELKNYPASVESYKKARSIDSVYFIDFNLSYSIDLAGLGEFRQALDAVNAFRTIPNLNHFS
jgi:Tfp pilus assembly protein PilF